MRQGHEEALKEQITKLTRDLAETRAVFDDFLQERGQSWLSLVLAEKEEVVDLLASAMAADMHGSYRCTACREEAAGGHRLSCFYLRLLRAMLGEEEEARQVREAWTIALGVNSRWRLAPNIEWVTRNMDVGTAETYRTWHRLEYGERKQAPLRRDEKGALVAPPSIPISAVRNVVVERHYEPGIFTRRMPDRRYEPRNVEASFNGQRIDIGVIDEVNSPGFRSFTATDLGHPGGDETAVVTGRAIDQVLVIDDVERGDLVTLSGRRHGRAEATRTMRRGAALPERHYGNLTMMEAAMMAVAQARLEGRTNPTGEDR